MRALRGALVRHDTAVLLLGIVAAGALLRARPLMGSDFPLNDGGMFLVMADEIRTHGFSLPAFTSYNQTSIPFAYPPLGLYAAAALTAPGLATAEVLRIAPLLLTVLTIPVMYLISRRLLHSRYLGVIATAVFGFTTGSYQWLVMGGGLTRSLGFLMALLAVYLAIRTYEVLRPWTAVACGVALGATALSHPQAAVFGALSVPLLLFFCTTDRLRAARLLLLAIGVAGAVVLPWLMVVVSQHGLSPILSATGTGGPALIGVISLASSRTSGGYFEVIGIATSVGLLISGVRRFWLPLVWIIAIALADSRAGQPYLSVPASLAIAFVLHDFGAVLQRSLAHRPGPALAPYLTAALAAVVVGAAFFDSLASQSAPGSPLRALPAETRSAMAWVESETHPASRFVVLSGRYWALDAEAEWFPALARRRSVSTVQGSEWQGQYAEQVARASALPRCVVGSDRRCIERWFDEAGDIDYLFLVDTPARELDGVECCHQLADQLSAVYDTQVVHREGEVLIVRLTPRSS